MLSTAGRDEYSFGDTAAVIVAAVAVGIAACCNIAGIFIAGRGLAASSNVFRSLLTSIANVVAVLLNLMWLALLVWSWANSGVSSQ